MDFNYQIITEKHEQQTGIIKASSKEAAIKFLQKPGVHIISLEEIKTTPYFYSLQFLKIFGRISRKDIVVFTRQLAVMYKSGIRLPEALRSLADQARTSLLKEKILKIAEEVESGVPFSQAISYHPELFNPLYINIVKSGEAAGKLSEFLDYLANHLEKEYRIVLKIKEALTYPIIISIVFLLVLAVMAVLVIPPLIAIIEEVGIEPPLVTRIIMAVAPFLEIIFLVLLVVFPLLILFLFRYSKTETGKRKMDKILLKIPLINSFFKKIYLARFAENLSVLIKSGLPIARALKISADTVQNTCYKEIILKTRDRVVSGELISIALKREPELIPPLFIQMTLVGEKTGRLSTTLMNIVNYYQQETQSTIEAFLKFLEPLMIILLGIIIGVLTVGILIPLYDVMII